MSVDASGEVVRTKGASAGLAAPIFEETQLFPSFVYALLLIITGVECVVLASLLIKSGQSMQGNVMTVGLVLALLCFLINLLVLRTRVEGRVLYVALGWVPVFWKRIALSEVESSRVVTYHPIRDAGGWGIRFGRFEGEACRFWNAKGNQGVLLVTADRRFIVGSQRSEELLATIRTVTGGGHSQRPKTVE